MTYVVYMRKFAAVHFNSGVKTIYSLLCSDLSKYWCWMKLCNICIACSACILCISFTSHIHMSHILHITHSHVKYDFFYFHVKYDFFILFFYFYFFIFMRIILLPLLFYQTKKYKQMYVALLGLLGSLYHTYPYPYPCL
jgi:hypothetical protein